MSARVDKAAAPASRSQAPSSPSGAAPISAFLRLILAAALAPALLATAASAAQPARKAPARPHAAAAARPAGPQTFTGAEYVMGSPTAPVTVIEYLSDTCSHCAHFDEITWPQTKAKYVDTGKVKWIVREFITPPEPISAAGFILARCAGKDRYFAVIEQIFKAQEEMFKDNQFKTVLTRIAAANGIDEKRFDACLGDDAAYKALYARVQGAMDGPLKIDSTPTIIINGKKTFEGVASFGELEPALIAAGAR